MLNKLTTLIREDYLNLEKKKNEKTNIEIQLYRVQNEIAELEKDVAKLENDRDFYTLVNLYNVYKDYDFPQDILEIVIKRTVFVTGRLCTSMTIADITFGEWLDLWKNGWIYEGNPVTFALSCLSGGYIKYWDLSEQKIITVHNKSLLRYDFKKRPSSTALGKGAVKDIILFVQTKICSKLQE